MVDNRRVEFLLPNGKSFDLVFSNVFIKHTFMQLLQFKSQTPDKIRIQAITWNQGAIS